MKFMLMMNAPRGDGEYEISSWPPADMTAHMNFMKNLNKELNEAGELVACEGLTPPAQARLVRAGKGGAPEVTDGPFAEAKEFLAGYWIVDVENAARAYAIAGRVSGAPGVGGKPVNISVEVRPVMGLPAPDM